MLFISLKIVCKLYIQLASLMINYLCKLYIPEAIDILGQDVLKLYIQLNLSR